MIDRSALLKDISEMVAAGVADDLSSDEIAGNVMVIVDTAELLANSRPVVVPAQGAPDPEEASYDRASSVPVAWIAFAGNGNIRLWTSDEGRAKEEKERGLDLRAFTLAELVALAGHGALPETTCCKGLAPAWECRCEIERKNAGHPPYYRSAVPEGDRGQLTKALRWIADQRWDENADLDTICTIAERALASCDTPSSVASTDRGSAA